MAETQHTPAEAAMLQALRSVLNRVAPGGFPCKRLDEATCHDIERIARAAIAKAAVPAALSAAEPCLLRDDDSIVRG